MFSGETVALRFSGGPSAGQMIVPFFDWPPADTILEDGGIYRKVRQSNLDSPMAGVMRGAEYEWEPTVTDPGQTAQQRGR